MNMLCVDLASNGQDKVVTGSELAVERVAKAVDNIALRISH